MKKKDGERRNVGVRKRERGQLVGLAAKPFPMSFPTGKIAYEIWATYSLTGS